MPAIALNPGFVLIAAVLLVLAAPRKLRAWTMGGAAALALWLLLENDFGVASAMEQMGLQMVLLNLDALNRIFGIAMLIVLIFIAVFSSARRERSEDAAILLLAGGSVSALFFGDLVGFVAAAALAGLAAAWVTFASPLPESSRAGARLLIWHGLEGLLFLVGVALHLPEDSQMSMFTPLDAGTLGGGFILAALSIRVGAPLAHVWLKDAVGNASPTGGAALSVFTTMLGVYALARLFPAEPVLTLIGAGMIGVGAFYAAAVDDLRRAGAYAQTAQTGVCVALIGVGSPLALAAAEAHAFALIFAFGAMQLALGAIVQRAGIASTSRIEGIARHMPITIFVLAITGLAASATPGFAAYATLAVALEASTQYELRWLWAAIVAASAVTFAAMAVRPNLFACRRVERPLGAEAPFPMQLGAGLAAFFSISVGLAPRWLYGLMPSELNFQPYAFDRLALQLEVLGAAGLVYLALLGLGAAPAARPALRVLDVDALYRGPLAAAGRWTGAVMLRLYGAWQGATEALGGAASRALAATARRCDRPYVHVLAQAAQFLSIAAALGLMLLAR